MKRVLELPEGWVTQELWLGKSDCVVLHAPNLGYVTIDFTRRNFAIGSSAYVPWVSETKRLKGRGWLQKLVADAVATLRKAS